MIVYEFKAKGKDSQYKAIDEAIRTYKFIRNSCLRYWMDNKGVGKYDLNKYCRVLAKEFPFANQLNSQARQSAAECTWSAISRFYENCKRKIPGKKGFPRFKKHPRSVEYKKTGWKLSENRKAITFTDQNKIGKLKLKGTYDLHLYQLEDIKRVRLVRRADGYYVQFCISVDLKIETEPTGKAIGLDVGIKYFLADSLGNTIENPKFYRKSEKQLNRANRRKSKKYVRGAKPQSKNYHKARCQYARKHLRVSRQRKEYCKRVAYCVIHSNDVVAYEDLNVKGMVKNRHLAKSISDVGWSTFRHWLEYFGVKYGKLTITVAPHNTSQNCSNCGKKVNKSLSTRTHICSCGYTEDRDINAAKNILKKALSTVGHTESLKLGEFNPLLMLEQSCIRKIEL
ncbi:MAG: IS200/IS605 family element transposase accessory protein TnpB [Moorea sp. SIO3I7]|uniref:Transposase n=1 Tax=Moorena bouillonii PNG TaxID=568701 RepID=A0A1U7N948_9CYAN|nr:MULTISPECIES: RNA-guided endonuclease TnpB family protein [Moorena]NEO00999.1 IS200/IS605 family element transposase accessory protein TnpB [Moorena sp. SIO3I7]NEO25306.1 IS200/IS605 family element transposase accessory protein TnpB [Moorena sp. SIO4A5]OLT62473.1 transposase [Moorena bouillonii PNG]